MNSTATKRQGSAADYDGASLLQICIGINKKSGQAKRPSGRAGGGLGQEPVDAPQKSRL